METLTPTTIITPEDYDAARQLAKEADTKEDVIALRQMVGNGAAKVAVRFDDGSTEIYPVTTFGELPADTTHILQAKIHAYNFEHPKHPIAQ